MIFSFLQLNILLKQTRLTYPPDTDLLCDPVKVLVQAVEEEYEQLLAVLLLERGKIRLVLTQRPPVPIKE